MVELNSFAPPVPSRGFAASPGKDKGAIVNATSMFQLCSPDFGYVTGTGIFVTGGQHLF